MIRLFVRVWILKIYLISFERKGDSYEYGVVT